MSDIYAPAESFRGMEKVAHIPRLPRVKTAVARRVFDYVQAHPGCWRMPMVRALVDARAGEVNDFLYRRELFRDFLLGIARSAHARELAA